MNNDELLKFLELDLFDLMGLSYISDADKERRLREMESNVLYDFLRNDVPDLLSDEQLAEIDKFSDKPGLTLADLNELLVKDIPDIESRLFEKSVAYRTAVIVEFIKLSLDICIKQKDLLDKGISPNPATPLTDKVKRMEELESDRRILTEVLALYEENKWSEGIEKLKGLSHMAQ